MTQQTRTKVNSSTPGGRVAWLLQKIWQGSQTRMAEDTGISQSAISNVVTGRRAPGREILTAISTHPSVNPAWLLTGNGNPLIVEERPAPAPDNHEQVAAYMESTGQSDQMHDMMVAIGHDMRQEFASIDDGLGPATKSTFTVREVAELTGLEKQVIREMIYRHEIRATNPSATSGLWFIPREEVRRLMPDSGGEIENGQPETAGTPTAPDLNSNNKI